MAVFAPMPSASVSTATAVKPGRLCSWRRANLRSFITQSLHRIDLCSASSGNPRREQPCEDENPGSGEKYNRIRRIHFKEHLLQRLSDGVRKKESPRQAESDEPQRVLEHEPNYVAPQRAEGDSQSDLPGSTRNEISLQSIEPDRRQDCRASMALLLRLPGSAPVFRRQRFLRVASRCWRDGAPQGTQSESAGRWGLTQARAVVPAGRQ